MVEASSGRERRRTRSFGLLVEPEVVVAVPAELGGLYLEEQRDALDYLHADSPSPSDGDPVLLEGDAETGREWEQAVLEDSAAWRNVQKAPPPSLRQYASASFRLPVPSLSSNNDGHGTPQGTVDTVATGASPVVTAQGETEPLSHAATVDLERSNSSTSSPTAVLGTTSFGRHKGSVITGRNRPGAFHRYGRPMGDSPSWSAREHELFQDEIPDTPPQPSRTMDPLPATLAPVPISPASPRRTPSLFHEGPEPVSADPRDHEIGFKMTPLKKKLAMICLVLVFLLGTGVLIGIVVASNSPRNQNDRNNNKSQGGDESQSVGTCQIGLVDLSCHEGEIIIPECAMLTFERLYTDFLPDIHPDLVSSVERYGSLRSSQLARNTASCNPESAALVYLAVAKTENPDIEARQDDYYLLALFFLSYKGGTEHDEPGWLSATVDPCEWPGIKCHSPEGTLPGSRIRRITLNSGIASGTIPTEIGLISNLDSFSIKLTPIKGTVPSEIGSLSHLRELHFEGAFLNGQIPSEIGRLSALETFEVSSQAVTGTLPSEIAHCTSLRRVKILRNVFMTGTVPAELGSLTALESIILAQILYDSGKIPTEFKQLTNLKQLELFDLELTGTIPTEFGSFSNLQGFNIAHNELFGSIPSEIGALHHMETLRLEDNDLTGTLPPSLGGCKSLEHVDLKGNLLRGTIPSDLGRLSKLRWFSINENNLSGTLPSTICPLEDQGLRVTADFCDVKRVNCIVDSCS